MGKNFLIFFLFFSFLVILVRCKSVDRKILPKYSNKWAIKASSLEMAKKIAERHDLVVDESYFKSLKGIYLLKDEKMEESKQRGEKNKNVETRIKKITKNLEQDAQVMKSFGNLKYRSQAKRFQLPSDPLFTKQWHLLNEINPQLDLNVVPAWNQSESTGLGVNKKNRFFFLLFSAKKKKKIFIKQK